MAGQLTYTQERVESLLVADPYFEDVTVVPFDKGDIQNIIDVALAKLGVAVLILTPSKTRTQAETPGIFSEIDVVCEVVENVIINRGSGGTGKPAAEVVEYVEAVLHGQPQPDDNMFVHKGSVLTGMGKNERNETIVTWAADFITYGGTQLSTTRAATPVITDNGSGSITITCATAGVNIRYTVNGKNPGTSGTLYTGAFNILSGVTVKARAWIWGLTISNQETYTRP